MPCYSPLQGFQSKFVTPNGKRVIVFNRSQGYADKPMEVPCGQCIGCRIDKSRMWAIRCVHESKLHLFNSFVTLTYDDEHLPKGQSLDLTELQRFFKKLRNHGLKFRYYACGEYGETTLRPHYHIIFFGIDFRTDRKKLKVNQRGDVLYTSALLSEKWGNGQCSIGSFNYSSAAYTARYAMKKQYGKDARQHQNYSRLNLETGEVYYVEPEFCVMSRNPGIGSGWYDKYKTDAFPSDFIVHEGKKHTVPRYYTDKLKTEDESMAKTISIKRKVARKKDSENQTSERLAVREEVKKSHISTLKRNL